MDTEGGGTRRSTGIAEGLHKRIEVKSLRQALPPLALQASVGPQCGSYIHQEFLQHGKRCRAERRALRAGIVVNGTHGMYHFGAACSSP